VAPFTTNLFDAVFGSGVAPQTDAELAQIADRSGLDGREFLRLLDDAETRKRHDRTIDEALAAGVFGVPSFVVEGELFWGNDRLILLRHHLGARG
jgi:2-hydroxychromene-2-carboxylate isomerase